jgi:hypothetical protein
MSRTQEYRRILVIAACVLLLAICTQSCATLGLDSNATAEQKRSAICQDAQTAYALSVVTIETAATAMTPQAAAYWIAYKAGAALAIKTYCGS